MPAPQPPDPRMGGVSPHRSVRDHFAEYVSKHNYIPMWAHPHVAKGIIRHFGRDGSVLIHPHPSTGYDPETMINAATGGVVPTQQMAQTAATREAATPGPAPAGPRAAAPIGPSLAGIPRAAAGMEGRSVFAGGEKGAAGPIQREPVFQAKGGKALLDARGGGKVPGRDMGYDSVHAMLQPGEAVFNKKQLAGIKVKPGKENLIRDDQKKAMRGAANRNAGPK